MNFFEDQRAARKSTNQLVFLYGLAIVITAILLAATLIIGMYLSTKTTTMPTPGVVDFFIYNQNIFYSSFVVIILVIVGISLFKIMSLGQGGEYVAKLAGAIPVSSNTNDFLLRRYINIVEEMSIASGTPIPQIFIMENETSINAFAAGYSIDDCVVAVTRGTLEKLNRDEIQGVIAHEFSHIFNGDMKLNIKLIGYLAGILVLSEIGQIMLRSGRHSRKNGGQLALVGIGFMTIGWGGYFLASIIKAMISRQREYLADASAMQYTRNPDGIGGALKKIYAASEHGLLKGAKVGEASHMFFTTAITGLFDTHPEMSERIKRIFPNINWRQFNKEEVPKIKEQMGDLEIPKSSQTINNINSNLTSSFSNKIEKGYVHKSFKNAGRISTVGIKKAKELLSEIPSDIQKILRDEKEVSFAIYAFFINNENLIENELISKVFPYINEKNNQLRFPILELAINTAKKINDQEKKIILKQIKNYILSDKIVTANEFVLYQLIKISFFPEESFFSGRLSQLDFYNYKTILIELCDHISNGQKLNFSSSEISKALTGLNNSSPGQKENILKEVVSIITADETITFEEHEFIRLTCLALSVPIPL